MNSRLRSGCIRVITALASGMWIFSGLSVMAFGEGEAGPGVYATPLAVSGIPAARAAVGPYVPVVFFPDGFGKHGHSGGHDGTLAAWINEQCLAFRFYRHGAMTEGTLGYGGLGLYPGFYGFGLSFHPGYGYGGYGLGVGAEGGYPFYGGPGYRIGSITFDGGPAFSGVENALIRPDYPYEGPSAPGQANAGMGPAYRARAEAVVGPANPYFGYNSGEGTGVGYRGGFGPFTGATAFPFTHPSYTAEAAATGTVVDPFMGAGTSEWRPLRGGAGTTTIPGVPPSGVAPPPSGNARPPTPDAGPGGPSSSAAPAGAGNLRLTAQLSAGPENRARPPYLPPVGNGPPPATR
jgi:hypothetical protein